MAENKIPDSEIREEEKEKPTVEDAIVDKGSVATIEDLREDEITTEKKDKDEDERDGKDKNKNKNNPIGDETDDKDEVEGAKTNDKDKIEGDKTDAKDKIEGNETDDKDKVEGDKIDDKSKGNGKNEVKRINIKIKVTCQKNFCAPLDVAEHVLQLFEIQINNI